MGNMLFHTRFMYLIVPVEFERRCY